MCVRALLGLHYRRPGSGYPDVGCNATLIALAGPRAWEIGWDFGFTMGFAVFIPSTHPDDGNCKTVTSMN